MTLTVLQQQMRHADTKTALRIYAHAIPQTQRDVMEGSRQLEQVFQLRRLQVAKY